MTNDFGDPDRRRHNSDRRKTPAEQKAWLMEAFQPGDTYDMENPKDRAEFERLSARGTNRNPKIIELENDVLRDYRDAFTKLSKNDKK